MSLITVWGNRVGYALELLLGCGARIHPVDEAASSNAAWLTFLKNSPTVSVDKALSECNNQPSLPLPSLTFLPRTPTNTHVLIYSSMQLTTNSCLIFALPLPSSTMCFQGHLLQLWISMN